jgi:hypothetical protein
MRFKWKAGLLTMGMAVSLAACTAAGEESVQKTESTDTEETVQTSSEDDVQTSEENAEESQDAGTDLSDTVTVEGKKISTPYFTAEIPEAWEGLYQLEAGEFEGGYSVSFDDTEAVEEYGSGRLCSIQVSPEEPVYIQYIGGDFVGVLKNTESGEIRYVSVSYPTEAPYEGEELESYLKMFEETSSLKDSIQAADGWQMQDTTYEEAMANVEGTLYGIVADASMHSFTFLDYTGRLLSFGGADLDIANLTDGGVHPGHCYELTYKGVIGDDDSTENAVFVSLENSDDAAGKKDYDACYTAAQVIMAFKYRSMDYIASLCQFPITLDGKEIESAEELSAMNFDEVFTDDLVRNVTCCELYYTEITGDSFSISLLQQAPEVVITKIQEGQWAVTAIRNN